MLSPFCSCQEVRPSLTEENVQRGTKTKELDELRRNNTQEKGFTVIGMWKCDWWRLYKTDISVLQHIREKVPYRRSLAKLQLLEEIERGKLIDYDQCYKEFPYNLKPHFATFSSTFKSNLVNCRDSGSLIKKKAVCRRKGLDISTSENANFRLQVIKLSASYFTVVALYGVRNRLWKFV